MHDIYCYYNYHKYLSDFYSEKKSSFPYFSYRYIGQKVGIDHGLVVKIFQGKRHVSARAIPAFAALLGLSRRKSEYFELMVLYGKAKTDSLIKHYFEKLLSFSGVEEHRVESDKYEFYQKWYYTAVREILHLHRFRDDYEWLANMVEPAITLTEAKKAVALLERLSFIKRNDAGFFELTSRFITTGPQWRSIAIRSYQKEVMTLAMQAIDTVPKEERDISTVTVTLDDTGFAQARDRIAALQKELVEISAACKRVNRAYQVNLQIFPITKKCHSPEKETAHE
jgi:uncharacterized protein (TIGR02147 family)